PRRSSNFYASRPFRLTIDAWNNKKANRWRNFRETHILVLAVHVRHFERRAARWAVWMLAQVLLLGIAGSVAIAQNTVGTVSDLVGSAHVERGGSTQPVTSGMG